MLKLGEIRIPQIELEKFLFIHDYQTKLFVQFSELIDKTDTGGKILQILSNDPRVKSLSGKMIANGSGAGRFEIKTLAMWFLWYANKVGIEKAEKSLNAFLDNDKVLALNCLWVLGINVGQEIEICDDIRLCPADKMVNSRDKEKFLQHRLGDFHNRGPVPEVALVCPCYVQKVWTENPQKQLDRNKDFFDVGKKLHEIALLLNLMPGIACWPYYSTSYVYDSTPLGPFSGSGGGMGIYDVMGIGSNTLRKDIAMDIKTIYSSYNKLPAKEKDRWNRILSRLSQSKRRIQIEDKILDLGIALEMMLLEDNKSNDQLSLSFRLRGGWLISKDSDERLENYKILREIYNYRSQVAHAGVLEKGDPGKIERIRDNFDKYQTIAENVCRHLLINGKPDWNKIVLNII